LKQAEPLVLTSEGTAVGLQMLPENRLLFSRSSLQGPNDIWLLYGLQLLNFSSTQLAANEGNYLALDGVETHQVTRFTEEKLRTKGLASMEDFYFTSAGGRRIHGVVVKPKGWSKQDKNATWPVAMLIHGGPESVWDDRWDTRWNLNVFAQQGYFIVAINPTGSTTFGQALTDAIQNDWGGKPFEDLRRGWAHILDSYPEIDRNRAVAAGPSWGGFAVK